jgi:hypothetical protein
VSDRYMMATQAIHAVGNISRDEPSLAIVYRETERDYIGEWATGMGFINVRFPKETTRELTDAERALYRTKRIEVGGISRSIDIDGMEGA